MSAALLREAAAKIRERAEAATGSPWDPILIEDEAGSADSYVISLTGFTSIGEDVGEGMCGQDAEHIASWHPAVALAVAKAMDDVALAWEIADKSDDGYVYDADDNHWRFEETVDGGWLDVARAYLGITTDSPTAS